MKEHKYYPWLVVALLWVVALLNYMDRQMLSTMQEAMKSDFAELQRAEAFGALMAIFLWVYGAVSPFAGMVADRLSRKWVVVGSLFVWSTVTLLMGWASSYQQLYALRALMGVSEALYIPAALSLIAEWHRGGARSLAVGIHMTGLYMGQAIGGFGATVAAAFSWEAAFHAFGVIGVAYSLLLAVLLRDPYSSDPIAIPPSASSSRPKGAFWQGLTVVLSTWAFWVILFYFAVSSLPGWATKNWLPTLFADHLSIPMSTAGPLSTITIAASSFAGVLVGGLLSDRWVRRNVRGRIFTSAIGLGMTIPGLMLMGLAHHTLAVVGAGLLFGVGFGMFDANSMPILCQFIAARHRATAYGVMNMTGVFAGAIVTQLLGKWTDAGGLGKAFALLGAVVAVAVIMQLLCLHPKSDDAE